jgi:hypothetical protein
MSNKDKLLKSFKPPLITHDVLDAIYEGKITYDEALAQQPIDWDFIGKLFEAGCSTDEACQYLNMNPTIVYKRCIAELNTTLTEYRETKMGRGNSLLRLKQFQMAMGGNITMLIWLGRTRLGQTFDVKAAHEQIDATIVNYGTKEIANSPPSKEWSAKVKAKKEADENGQDN